METRIEEEWQIVDYYPCLEEDEEEETERSKLGWVVDTGLNVGKKLVITVVVISSAPFVLPPLVVTSALGFAFSVPFGVVFASYACTQKLMSKLLPSPGPTLSPDKKDQEPVVGIDVKGKEQSGDRFEVANELIDDEYDDDGLRDEIMEHEDLARDKSDNDFPNNVEVGEVNEDKSGVQQYSLEQGMYEKPSFDVEKIGDYAVVAPGRGASFEVQNAKLIEKVGKNNTANARGRGNSCQENNKKVEKIITVTKNNEKDTFMENEGEKNDMNKRERENFFQEKNEKVEKIITERKKTEDDKKQQAVSKGKFSSKETVKRGKNKNFGGNMKEREGDRRNGKHKELMHETKTSFENNAEEQLESVEKFAVEEKRENNKASTMLEGGNFDNNLLLMNAEIGDIDGSVDKEEKDVGLKDGAISETVEGDSTSSGVVEEKIEVCAVVTIQDDSGADGGDHSSSEVAEHDKETLNLTELEKDDCGEEYGGLHAKEKLFSDEKIWEKINAIRIIVGFMVPRRDSYFEELKALYLFTGIEAPSSSSDRCDFVEFYSKLCFLMSVIGLK